MIALSANELEGMARKAALGRGWGHGLAGPFGRAIAWISAEGADGATLALDALTLAPAQVVATRTGSDWSFPPQPLIAAGPSIFDLLGTGGCSVVSVEAPQPLALLAGYAGAAATKARTAFLLEAEGLDLEVSPGAARGPFDQTCAQLRIRRIALPNENGPAQRRAIEAPPEAWHALSALAIESYVPATEHARRTGAGAGLVDTD